MSDIHRQDDFLWSAVGLIYALVLWFCARNITGAVLLGQASASILIVSYSWQTLKLRKVVANPERAEEISSFSVLKAVNGLLTRFKPQPKVAVAPSVTDNPKVTESEIAIPDTTSTESPLSQGDGEIPDSKPERLSDNENETLDEQPLVTDTEQESLSPEPESPPATPVVANPNPTDNIPSTSNRATTTTADEPVIGTIESPETDKTEVTKATPSVDPVVKNTVKEESKPISTSKPEIPPRPEKIAKSQPIPPVIEEKEPKTIADSTQNIVPVPPPNQTDLDRVETTTESITETIEEAKQEVEQPVKQPKPPRPDSLDFLETVEVAEILEAIPEDRANKDDLDRTNIIEVTTTEIDAIAPEKKLDSDIKPESNSEST